MRRVAERGPYKRHDIILDVPVPESTQRYRLRAEQENVEENVQQDDDDQNSYRSRSSLGSHHSSVTDSGSEESAASRSSESENEAATGSEYEIDGNSGSERTNTSDSNSSDESDAESVDSATDNSDSGENSDDSDDENNRDEGAGPGGCYQEPADQEPAEERVPLYDGCPITKREGTLLIMNFAIRFGLSDKAIKNLLNVIDCHMPVRNVYGSWHKFKKLIPEEPLTTRRYYCPNPDCHRPVVFEEEEDIAECACEVINDLATLNKDANYFISLKLKDQLISLLQDETVLGSLRWQDRNETDVINGQFYKTCVDQGIVRLGRDLTLQFNTDGAQVFTSSNIQMWPIQVTINELPFKLRKDSILLCGLWFGGKPNMNTFMEPFVEELTELHRDGFELPGHQPRVFRVHTILCTVDSMARPSLQGLKTFRGHCGCCICLHPGLEVDKSRYYRGDIHELRTPEQHRRDTLLYVNQAGANRPDVNGIIGYSPLAMLPIFNVAQSFVPDYLHAVLLGVVKTMVCKFWTKSATPPAPQHEFYIGNPAKLHVIDTLLLSIKPPCELTRTPRKFSDNKLWRGHEWKNFLCYFSLPILKGANFPDKYVNHWFLFVYAISIFLGDNVSEENYQKATSALRKFVLTAEQLYNDVKVMKFNMHLLLHIPKSVRDFGSLWAWSTFSYEHYNGVLTKLFKSSQSANLQIVKNYVRLQGLKHETLRIANNVGYPECLKFAIGEIESGKKTRHAYRVDRHLTLLGKPIIGELSVELLHDVEGLLGCRIQPLNVLFYKRFIYKHVLHHVENYLRLQKRFNCIVKTTENQYISISDIIKLQTTEPIPREFAIVLGSTLAPTGDQLCTDRVLRLSSDDFVTVVRRTEQKLAILPHMIDRKCVFTFYPRDHEKFCCYPLLNLHERD